MEFLRAIFEAVVSFFNSTAPEEIILWAVNVSESTVEVIREILANFIN